MVTLQVQAGGSGTSPAEEHVMQSNTGAEGNLFSLYEHLFSYQANLAAVLLHVFMFIFFFFTEFYLGKFSFQLEAK